jgi:hypothetical protein
MNDVLKTGHFLGHKKTRDHLITGFKYI